MADRLFNHVGFQEYLKEHKVMGCRNKTSGKLYLPPRAMCPESHTTDMEWVEISGKGKLIGFTVITVGPTFMIEDGYNRDNPFCAGIVQLDDGPAISAQIFGVDVKNPENIKIGTEVQATFIERGQEPDRRTYLGFEAV